MLKPKKSVEKMSGYFVPLYEKQWDYKLDSNENNYGPSGKVLEALKNCDFSSVSFYPFYGELSQKIADYNNVNLNNIKVTNGADEAISGIIQTYLEEGESLLTLDISFEMPVIYTHISGGEVIKVPFKTKWNFPINDFLKEMENPRVKIIYVASPNNPTGNIIDEDDLKRILDKSLGKAVIIDETYANYSGYSYTKYAKLYNNVFVVKSFSKDFALAGMRLGYIISNENNINYLKNVISPFSVNAFALKAGIAALGDLDYFNRIKTEINQSKTELKVFFETFGAVVYKSYANFLLVDFKEKAEFVFNKLKSNNITVKLFKRGSLLENHLRITIPTKEGVEKIKDILSDKPMLVFDMDGVLIDASNSYRLAIEKTYEKYTGKSVSKEEIQAAKNLGGLNNDWDLTQYLLKKEGINIKYSEIVDVFQSIYWDNGNGLINNESFLFDKNILLELSKQYNLAIYTGRPKKEAFYALKKFDVVNLFYPIVTSDDVPEGKCKPDSYGLNYIKDITISNKYYYMGDTIDDMKCAIGADYYPIGVLPPQDKSEFLINSLKSNGAKDVIISINDLKDILEKVDETICQN